MKKLLPALFVALLMVLHPEAEAKRMGGGKSIGQQSSNVTQRSATPPNAPPLIEDAEPFAFDLERRRLTLRGEPVELTDREFDLLVFLFQRRGKVVSRETLLSQVWRVGPNVTTRSIDTYVSRLRKRLDLQGDSEWRLEGIYQHGYRLVRVHPDDPMPMDAPETSAG